MGRWLGPAGWLVGAALLGCPGCSDGGSPSDVMADAAVDVGPADGGPTRSSEPPAPTAPPELTPCPEGWVPRFVEGDVPECAPWSEPPPPLGCDFTEMRVPGEDGCAPVGASCPADGWPAELPAEATVLYVRAGETGGDGSRAQPFGTIGAAMEEAGDGTIVAVATGEYDEAIALPAGVELRGACPAETRLTSSAPAAPPAAVIETAGRGAAIRDVTIGFAARAGVYVAPGGSLAVEGVVVAGVEGVGLAALGELEAEGVAVRDVGGAGRGLTVEGDGRATVRRAVFEDNGEVGLFSSAELHVEDAVVRGPPDDFDLPGFGGPGLSIEGGGSAELVRTVIEGNARAGAMVLDGSSLSLQNVVLRDNADEALRVSRGGSVELRRVTVGPHPWGLLARGTATRVTAEDTIVRGGFVTGVSLGVGVEAELRRVLVTDSRAVGVMVHGEGTSLTAEDLWILATEGDRIDGSAGRGLNVQQGARAEVTRARLEGNRNMAAFVSGPGSELGLRDAMVRDTRSREDDGRLGSALFAQGGARATVERAELEGNRGVAALAIGEDTELVARDLLVRDTRAQGCATTSCSDAPAGVGVGAYGGASSGLEGFDVIGSPLCGVQVAADGRLELHRGRVTDNAIGACIQVEGYDVDLLRDAVEYRDNDVNLDTTELPVPDPQPTLEPE